MFNVLSVGAASSVCFFVHATFGATAQGNTGSRGVALSEPAEGSSGAFVTTKLSRVTEIVAAK